MNNSTKDADVVPREAIFANGLEKLGCKQGQNLILDVRWSAGDRTLMGRYGSHPEGERRQAGDLPIQLATKFSLVINQKAARAIDVDLPMRLMMRADEIIE
jgi:hypothetical protein